MAIPILYKDRRKMEKLDYLINYLLEENKNIKIKKLPNDINDKKFLYRALCNIRSANEISEKYLQIENEYLQEQLKTKNITKVSDLSNDKKICLWQGDITTIEVDAIVNAANSQGLGCFIPCHKCIDNQINTAAGILLRLECNKIMKLKDYNLKTGEAILTKGYNLPSKYVIHTVGPIIYGEVKKIQEEELANCYINSLKLAKENNIRTIVFPCISTGEYRFPKRLASEIAIKTVKIFLKENINSFEKIVFNVFTDADYKLYKRVLNERN